MESTDGTGGDRDAGRVVGIDVSEFEGLRRYLFAVAYRLLGSASEAEDIVQEAYLRVHEGSAADVQIQSAKAYLATVVTRLCLDQLKSARAAREVYVGPWLPEPALTSDLAPTPAEAVERGEEISFAFLILLERLTPEERAAYVLREAFDYPYEAIAEILEKSTAAVRQLAHRARERIAAGGSRFQVIPEAQRRLAERFLAASRAGDLQGLTEVLAADVTSWVDGGATTRAARRPIQGRDDVSRWLVAAMTTWWADTRTTLAEINGGVASLFWRGQRLICVVMVDVDGDRVQAMRAVVNPAKIAYLQRRLGGSAATTP